MNEDFETLIEAVTNSGTKEVQIMYIESLLNLIQLEQTAPELVRQGLLEVLSELFSTNSDKDIIRLCARILDKLCKNEVLVDSVFKAVKMPVLIAKMYVSRDVETARLAFHMAKTFSKFARMQGDMFNHRNDLIQAIMNCIRDRDITAMEKREALQLVPYMMAD